MYFRPWPGWLLQKDGENMCTVCWWKKSLHTSKVAHQAGTYPGFHSMKKLEIFFTVPLDGMLVHCRVIPSINSLLPIYTHEWKEALWELSIFRKNTIVSLVRAQTRTAWSGERNLILRVSHSLKDCRRGMDTSTPVVMLVLLTSWNGHRQ